MYLIKLIKSNQVIIIILYVYVYVVYFVMYVWFCIESTAQLWAPWLV
jgi:hypothetical protein